MATFMLDTYCANSSDPNNQSGIGELSDPDVLRYVREDPVTKSVYQK